MTSAKIKILPENIANKIAAGEVVQRPESVVKELLENAVDAHASSIDVIVKRAGKSLIQVVDDGEGMTEEDALMCLQRHATSKIAAFEDLNDLRTFGFRGEALSSITSVSQLEIKTETRNEEMGTCLKVEDGQTISKEKGSFSKGTSISVKNLFFNTPARRNFLKSDATELKHIIETFKKTALSQPLISFRFFNDDDLVFDFPAGTREERICSVFADNMLDALIGVKELTDYISVSGYIAKPAFLKKSKGEQYLFINNRYVVSKQINHAVFSAYEHLLEKGDYPFYILFVDLDPSRIDINVHPSKLEVKFEDEKDIYTFVHAVIKKGLGSYDLVPSMNLSDTAPHTNSKLEFDSFRRTEINNFTDRPFQQPGSAEHRTAPATSFSDRDIDMIFSNINPELKRASPQSEIQTPFHEAESREIFHKSADPISAGESSDSSGSFIIQLHNKYILSQIKSG
ncbi:MAG: DNA mismatch repair endonuclease MutL, partial [Syntrophothermus sp.]